MCSILGQKPPQIRVCRENRNGAVANGLPMISPMPTVAMAGCQVCLKFVVGSHLAPGVLSGFSHFSPPEK